MFVLPRLSVKTFGHLLKCLFGDDKPANSVQQSISEMARVLLLPWIQRLKSKFPMDKDFEGPVYELSKGEMLSTKGTINGLVG